MPGILESLPKQNQKKKGEQVSSKVICSQTDVVRVMSVVYEAPGYCLPYSGKCTQRVPLEMSQVVHDGRSWFTHLNLGRRHWNYPHSSRFMQGHYNISTLCLPLLIHSSSLFAFWPSVAHWTDILIELFIMMPRSFPWNVPAHSEPIRPISVRELEQSFPICFTLLGNALALHNLIKLPFIFFEKYLKLIQCYCMY